MNKRIEISAENPTRLLLVYGTLRTGQHNNYLLQGGSKLIGTFETKPEYTMFGKGAGFPIVVTKGNTSIKTEVYEVTDLHTLASIHRLEGCSGIPGHPENWYDIQPVETPYGEAHMYVMHEMRNDTKSVITTGDWLNQK